MQFYAHIISGSAIDKQWRQLLRVGGKISEINFRLVEGRFVSSEALTEAQVIKLRHNRNVKLEVATLTVLSEVTRNAAYNKSAVEPMPRPSLDVIDPPVESARVAPLTQERPTPRSGPRTLRSA